MIIKKHSRKSTRNHTRKNTRKSTRKNTRKSTRNNSISSNNNSTRKCTQPTSINYCQDKSSGGHQGTIFSINKNTCIKKMSKINNEIIFYNKHKKLIDNGITVLSDYIPKYNGICKLNDSNFFEMENLKGLFEQPLSIDIKLGYQTVSKKIIKNKTNKFFQIYSKLAKHYILDKFMTHSAKNGFRIEGVSLPNNLKFKKMDIMRGNYKTIFDYYFTNDINNKNLKLFIKQLIQLSHTIENSDFNRYFFIGASILFTYDGLNTNNDPTLKLIDFENSLILENENDIKKNIEHANSIRKSIKSLTSILTNYLENKEKH